jgi:DNA replication protein
MTTGFPNSAAGTVIPNAFFATVLPQISDPAELVISTYLFFAIGQKQRHPRFVTLRELQSDATLAHCLTNLCPQEDRSPLARRSGRGEGGERSPDPLTRGLDLALQRGTLIRATSGEDTLYTINLPSNVRAFERLAAEGIRIDAPLAPKASDGPPNIYTLYEANIGSITPLIAEDLHDAEERFPPAWIEDAIREAAELNKRSWRYVRAILQRWETEGRHEEHRRDPEADWLARRYRAGKRPPAGTPR